MSSRLHRNAALDVQPVEWMAASGPAAPRAPVSPPLEPRTMPGAGSPPEAADSIRELELEAEGRIEAARQRGVQEGLAAAREEASRRLDGAIERLARSVEEMSGLRARLRREAEQDVVTLALAIARRVLHRELTMDPEALLGLVKAALEKIDVREVQRVRVHPENAAMLERRLEAMGLPRKVEVEADAGLERGAAVLETSRGALDASTATQLAEIERGFADLAGKS